MLTRTSFHPCSQSCACAQRARSEVAHRVSFTFAESPASCVHRSTSAFRRRAWPREFSSRIIPQASATIDEPGQAGEIGKNKRIRNIIIALDTSKESESAVQWALNNLARAGDVFHLLHCVPSLLQLSHYSLLEGDMTRMNLEVLNAMEDHITAAVREGMYNKFSELFNDRQVAFEIDVMVEELIGELGVGEEICRQAESKQAGAVVVSSHGKSWLSELLVGSVSNYVAHHCKQPVVILHNNNNTHTAAPQAGPEGSGRCIVVAVDDSDISENACKWTLNQLYRTGDSIHLLHVVPQDAHRAVLTVSDGMAFYIPQSEGEENQQLEGDVKQIEGRCCRVFQAQGVPYSLDVITGHTATSAQQVGGAICEAAEKLPASLLVMGNHTPPGLAEMVMGSVTHYCTHRCNCPVAVLH